MRRVPASLLTHRGHGPAHLDLILADGSSCRALSLTIGQFGWRARWGDPHRRRYLAWSGPVSAGRGAVRVIWRGNVCWYRQYLGWRFHLAGLTTLSMRRGRLQYGHSLGRSAGTPAAALWDPRHGGHRG